MAAHDHHLAGGLLPLEVERRRQRDIALATVVDIAHVLAVGGDRPAEHADVGNALTDLETRQQLAVTDSQLQQTGVLVVGVQLVEIGDETGLSQEAALQRHRFGIEAVRGFHQAVEGEHVGDAGFLLQPQEHVVTEQQALADLDDIAGDAVVLGADTHPTDSLHGAAAELGQTLAVERFGQTAQALALLLQAPVQHLVGAAFGDGLVQYVLCVCVRHRSHPESAASKTPLLRGAGRLGWAASA